MNFYKTTCMIAIGILIISLATIGTALANSNKQLDYPPNKSSCPDLYYLDEDNLCKSNDPKTSESCNAKSFSDVSYDVPGIGRFSGNCSKKKWASDCNVDWDGITNNPDICHSTNH